jgi:hypothetical protein
MTIPPKILEWVASRDHHAGAERALRPDIIRRKFSGETVSEAETRFITDLYVTDPADMPVSDACIVIASDMLRWAQVAARSTGIFEPPGWTAFAYGEFTLAYRGTVIFDTNIMPSEMDRRLIQCGFIRRMVAVSEPIIESMDWSLWPDIKTEIVDGSINVIKSPGRERLDAYLAPILCDALGVTESDWYLRTYGEPWLYK